MTNTTKFYRKASVSRGAAIQALFSKMPDADLVSFEQKVASAEEAKAARAAEGDQIFVATIRTAEFPPSKNEAPEEEAPKGDAPPSDPDDDGDDDSSPEGDTDKGVPSFDSESDGPPAPGEDKGEPKAKKMKPEEEMVHLLHQILDALKGGGAGPGDLGPGGPGDLDVPDIGAPEAGGPPMPPPKKAPLPPPVPPKAGPGAGGMGAFSKVIEDRADFTFRREAASELNNASLLSEAMEMAPGFRVAKIDRRSEKDQDAALVTMVRA